MNNLNKSNKLKSYLLIFIFIFIFIFSPLKTYAYEENAVFAGGCFWCLEHDLENIPGVISVESGYSGGDKGYPTYPNHTGHREVISIKYESKTISYKELLRKYWRNIDPFDKEGQFCDKGDSYRAAIYFGNEEQKDLAFKSLDKASKELNVPLDSISVEILPLKEFWIAERYHQDFAINNELKYSFYRFTCGRDNRLKEVWGKKAGEMNRWSQGGS